MCSSPILKVLQLQDLPDDVKRKKKSVYKKYLRSGKNHYFGRFPIDLTHKWQSLPSVFPDEQLKQFYLSTPADVEIKKSLRDSLYVIRLKKGAPRVPKGTTFEMLLSRRPPKYSFNDLPDEIRDTAKFCRGFREQELNDLKPDASAHSCTFKGFFFE